MLGRIFTTRRRIAVATAMAVILLTAGVAHATLPSTSVPPNSVPLGVLAGNSALNVLSTDAFTRAIHQGQGTNVVLTRSHFDDGQSTGWHTHPGPNIVLVVSGEFRLTDSHCNVTTYRPGQGFATGLDVHQAVAVGATEFYSLYFLPKDADVLRTDDSPPVCATH